MCMCEIMMLTLTHNTQAFLFMMPEDVQRREQKRLAALSPEEQKQAIASAHQRTMRGISQQHKQRTALPAQNAYMLMYRRQHAEDPSMDAQRPAEASMLAKGVRERVARENAQFQMDKAEHERIQSLIRIIVHVAADSPAPPSSSFSPFSPPSSSSSSGRPLSPFSAASTISAAPTAPAAPGQADEEGKTRRVTVEVPRTHTLAAALELLRAALATKLPGEADSFAAGLVRLRMYDVASDALTYPFSAADLGLLVTDPGLQFKDFAHVGVERRAAVDLPFEDYVPPQMGVLGRVFDRKSGDYWPQEQALAVEVDAARGTVGDLRAALAAALGARAQHRVVHLAVLGADGKSLRVLPAAIERSALGALGVEDGDAVFVELLTAEEEAAREAGQGELRMVLKFDEDSHKISISFNDVFTRVNSPSGYLDDVNSAPGKLHVVEVDSRKPMSHLKTKVAARLGLDQGECVLRKHGSRGQIKNLDKKVSVFFLGQDAGQLDVELGTPLKPSERLFTVFLAVEREKKDEAPQKPAHADLSSTPTAPSAPSAPTAPSAPFAPSAPTAPSAPFAPTAPSAPSAPTAPRASLPAAAQRKQKESSGPRSQRYEFRLLGSVVLDGSWSLARAKGVLAGLTGAPSAAFTRVREKSATQLTHVWVDGKTVKKNCPGDDDGRELVLQETKVEETLGDDSLLLNVQQWFPAECRLGRADEMAFARGMKLSALKQCLGELHGLPTEEVRVVKPRLFKLKDKQNIPGLDWFGMDVSDGSSLGGAPWKCRSGDFVLFKDNRAQERAQEDAKALQLAKLKQQPERQQPRALEMGVKFYTKAEIVERRAEEARIQELCRISEAADKQAALERASKKKEDMSQEEKAAEAAEEAARRRQEAESAQARAEMQERLDFIRRAN
jgi:hypothetical protein